ncbi:thioredoxin domain-containing protein [Demequina flava]|uniref:thioredoxin domain-containing protein n=1 Tax=Demequina flava TaxID=1095025 RepID=UPI0007848155|nr:thioredoxin domain-containing protein [Demequina flava]
MAKKKPQPSNSKAAQARANAQAQVKAEERRTGVIIAAVSAVVILIFGGVVWFIIQSGQVPGLDSEDLAKPAASDVTGGIPVGTSGVVGEDLPEDQPRLDIYLDYMCPICGQFEDVNAEDLDAMREAGEVEVYYHPISILDRFSNGTEYSSRAANAVATVAEEAPSAFLDFSNALFESQPAEGTEGLSDEQISQIAVAAGVPEDVAAQIENGDYRKWVIAATDQSSQDGVPGTPTLRIAEPGQSFDEGKVLEQSEVPYFEPGQLRTYIESF